jgi:hypothetical protein
LLNTTGKKQNKQSKRLINTNPTKTGCELMWSRRANKRSRIPKGQSKKDNPQKEENQSKDTTQYGLDTTMPNKHK